MTAATVSFAGFALVLALTAQVVLEVMHAPQAHVMHRVQTASYQCFAFCMCNTALKQQA